jgi:Bacterial PH domain
MGLLDGIMGNASRVDPGAAAQEYGRLLARDEQVHAAYVLVRDAILFTDRRLVFVDKQGLTSRKVSYHTVPYRGVTHFSVETAGTFDLDAELRIWVSGSHEPILKQFGKGVDVYEVQAMLAHWVAVAR